MPTRSSLRIRVGSARRPCRDRCGVYLIRHPPGEGRRRGSRSRTGVSTRRRTPSSRACRHTARRVDARGRCSTTSTSAVAGAAKPRDFHCRGLRRRGGDGGRNLASGRIYVNRDRFTHIARPVARAIALSTTLSSQRAQRTPALCYAQENLVAIESLSECADRTGRPQPRVRSVRPPISSAEMRRPAVGAR